MWPNSSSYPQQAIITGSLQSVCDRWGEVQHSLLEGWRVCILYCKSCWLLIQVTDGQRMCHCTINSCKLAATSETASRLVTGYDPCRQHYKNWRQVLKYLECVGLCEIDGSSIQHWDVDVDNLCRDVTERQVAHYHFGAVPPFNRYATHAGYPYQLYICTHILHH